MFGKIIFAVGVVVFLVATAAAVAMAVMHIGIVPKETVTMMQQYIEMGKQLWLPESFALGFALVGSGLLLMWKKDTQ